MKEIYLDHAATTKVDPDVLKAMLPYFTEYYGNPSTIYKIGIDSKKSIINAKKIIKDSLNIKEGNIYFTSGGTEADNWALRGILNKGDHLITSKIEHHAILNTCHYLESIGVDITYLDVDKEGLINPDDIAKNIKSNTKLISIMYVNNEIGVIQDMAAISKIAKERNILFHTDAVQALGHLNIDFSLFDLVSLSAHKIYGPKGTGLLYIGKGIRINNLLFGGAQEERKRPGTENVPGIIGFATAIKRAMASLDKEMSRQQELRDYTINKLLEIPYTRLNGSLKQRVANNINISFEFIEGEAMILNLNNEGIYVSSGSACTSLSLEPSHVLLAMGIPHEIAHGSLRITLGEETTKEELDIFIYKLTGIITKLRKMSPLYEDFIKEEKHV